MYISEEHLTELRKLSDARDQIVLELGRNQAVLVRANLEKENLEMSFKKILNTEMDLHKLINDTYGNVNINLQDGKITPQP